MEIQISEERKAELLRKDKEEKENRRKLLENGNNGYQDLSEANQYSGYSKQFSGSRLRDQNDNIDTNQGDISGKMVIASILNNKYQGDNKQSEGLFEVNHQENEDYENYEDIIQKGNDPNSHIDYIQNIQQKDTVPKSNFQQFNNQVQYGVEQLIQEKLNANQGNLFSLDQIKQRLQNIQQRNADMKQQFQQNIQNISTQNEPETQNAYQMQQQQGGQSQQFQPSFVKYMNPASALPPHPTQARVEKNYNQMPLSRNEDNYNQKENQQSKSAKKLTYNTYLQQNKESSQQQLHAGQLTFQGDQNEQYEEQRQNTEQSLYEKKRSNSYTQKRTEQEYIQQTKFPFKPEIKEIPKNIYGDCDKLKISRQEQWERLLRDKIETLTSRENLKILQQQKEISENCTFVPQISDISKLIMADKQENQPIQDRLYAEGLKKQQEREELKRKYEDSKTYPFKPNIEESIKALKGNAAFTKPLYQRVDEVVKERQESRLQLQMQTQNDQQYTFKPILNPKSEVIAKDKIDGKSVVQRLLDDIQEKEQRKSKIIENHNHSVSQMCTFQPSINPSNRDDDEQKDSESYQKRQEEFVQRQYLMADYLKEKLEAKIKEIYSNSEYTFKPQVNQVSKYLIEADEERATETTNDKIKRLHEQDNLKKQIVQEQIQKAYYDQFQFKPEINPLSKKIARKRSLDSLAFDKDKNQKKKKIKEKVENEKMKECTFQPTVNKNKKYNNLKSHYAADNIQQSLKEEKENKEKQINQIKKQIEYEEMKECTFNPVTKQLESVDYKEKLQNMRGIDKFLQQKELAKKQQEINKKREEEVFNVKDMSQYRDSNKTVIQPFKLSKGFGPIQKKPRADFLQECTFQPQTNESKNKEIIKKIISNQNGPNKGSKMNNNEVNYENQYEQVPEIEEINYELQKNMYKNLQINNYSNNYENVENINKNIQQHIPRQQYQNNSNQYSIYSQKN
ncbi:hypothetical protein TTHERM_00727490 (macronuclear) [Tetrahymena thermophila SB210]|uniref:Uncharacterized protein n=1 Tax=Tetrahymena thermophila (strain SB210) TaxID=312017 RepID=I7MLJ0_TETTS|nr:hypothetical protein TTHERM_00727490 [Tetrahymena thermophila SB210]EAS02389.1 hypothetical protein TTHERM_00727490 [Tetrahymena thermophila SB210]|eukprot:XP_001022634.1 hypothetical protein TTHERM_00727490 [Tetrahymena thermophila SB210]